MRPSTLVAREIRYRPGNFTFATVAVAAATAVLIAAVGLLKDFDRTTRDVLERQEGDVQAGMHQLEDDVRKATLLLGLNLAILPEDQDLMQWHANDFGTVFMPDAYADKLADSGVVTVRHLLPVLQRKLEWPERRTRIILVGTRGEVPNLHKNPRAPLVQPVPDGTAVVGGELSRTLGLGEGDTIRILGEPFTVHRCHEPRGTKDDITVWINLGKAQEMLDRPGRINAIIALQCMCAGTDTQLVKDEIQRVLPDTQVVELGTDRIAARVAARTQVGREAAAAIERTRTLRTTMRMQRELASSILVAVVMAVAALWVGLLAAANARARLGEIALFRALGFGTRLILRVLLARAVLIGLVGSAAGCAAGVAAAAILAGSPDAAGTLRNAWPGAGWLLGSVAAATLLTTVASWLPAWTAATRDPAMILSRETS